MAVVYLGLGTNLGDRATMLRAAIDALARHVRVRRSSSVYETAPWGRTDQPAFLNCCVAIETEIAPLGLLALAKEIERSLGRVPGERWGPRAIDIDVLLYGDERIDTAELVVPHPRLHERTFALVPLAEIAPDVPLGGGLTALGAAGALARAPGDVRRVGDPIVPSPDTAR